MALGCLRAARGMVQDCVDLGPSHAGEPRQELLHRSWREAVGGVVYVLGEHDRSDVGGLALVVDDPVELDIVGVPALLVPRHSPSMLTLRAEEGVTFLFIEHDMEVVMNHSDRVIVMAGGFLLVGYQLSGYFLAA